MIPCTECLACTSARDAARVADKLRQIARATHGRCVRCGKRKPAPVKSLCRKCLRGSREKMRRFRDEK